jgi:hypothetical protein
MGGLLLGGRISSGVRTMAEAGHGVDYVKGNRSGSTRCLEGGRGRKSSNGPMSLAVGSKVLSQTQFLLAYTEQLALTVCWGINDLAPPP